MRGRQFEIASPALVDVWESSSVGAGMVGEFCHNGGWRNVFISRDDHPDGPQVEMWQSKFSFPLLVPQLHSCAAPPPLFGQESGLGRARCL